MTEKIMTMEEKKTQLDKVRRAFRNPDLQGWIPRYLLTILEEGDAIEDTLSVSHANLPQKSCGAWRREARNRMTGGACWLS